MKKINIFKAFLLLIGVLFLNSCSEETYPETRLFRPVLNQDLIGKENTILVDMGKMKDAVSYKYEISRDQFATVLRTIETPGNKIRIMDLLWNTEYQVRVTAIAASPEFNSKVSDLGAVRTEKFPSILITPDSNLDFTDISAKVRWQIVAGDKEITAIKVFAATDEALLTPLDSYDTTPAEILAGTKIIPGLSPGTNYQLAIYSGETIRGWDFYTTKPAIVTNGDVIDLRLNTDPNALMTTLKDPLTKSGTTIILNGDMTYNATGHNFDKSIKILSGYSINSFGAVINISSNFNLAPASVISSIIFEGVTITGNTSTYIFNLDASANIENIKFENCRIATFRGLLRAKGGSGVITNFAINNSIVKDIRDYGIINMDIATWSFSNIALTNSTFYKCQKFIVCTKVTTPSKSILISDCTLNEETALNNKIISFAAANNVTDGVNITNTIIGRGWDMGGAATTFGIDPIDGLLTTNFTISNSFATADFTLTPTGTAIPGFPNFTYSKTMKDLWKDPDNGDFNFIDSSFQGIKTSGDPRWRKQ